MKLLSRMSMISCENISKRYQDKLALVDVSFELQKGQVLGLLGSNGAGKTTLLHILLGILTSSSGKVRVLGLDPIKDRHQILKRINFTSAYTQLPTNLKVRENLKIFSKIYNVRHPKNKIDKVSELFELGDFMNRVCGALSSGEKTRLNLAKSFLNDPEILLLDEPTASLDPEMADKVRNILKKIHRENEISMIYTSHNMKEVEELCDEVIFIQKGKIRAKGDASHLKEEFASKDLEEVFIKIVRQIESV